MSTTEDLAVRDEYSLLSRCDTTLVSLVMPDDISFDDWSSLLGVVSELHAATPFMLGDAVNSGEDRFGETAPAAYTGLRVSDSTRKEYSSVMRRVPKTRRRAGLSFAHHKAVMALSAQEQRDFLKDAFEKEWPASRLRAEVLAHQGREQTIPRGERLRLAANAVWISSVREQDGDAVSYRVPEAVMFDLLEALGEPTPEGTEAQNNGA